MINWFFRKRAGAPSSLVAPAQARAEAPPAPPSAADKAHLAALAAEARAAEDAAWAPRLAAAQGDDAALLALAQSAPRLELKLAAVEAIRGEDALKKAERHFRSHDRKVHRVAKRRFEAAVAEREARAAAQALIATASTLADAAAAPDAPVAQILPANRLVALDDAWNALPAALLDAPQHAAFAALRERLNAALHAQGERELQARRDAEAARAHAVAEAAAREAAAQRDAEARHAEDIAARAAADAAAAAPPAVEAGADATAPPPVAPKRLTPEQRREIDASLQAADAALADGRLDVLQAQLHTLDAQVQALAGAPLGEALRTRLQGLHAERARLKGWQHWGGARARDTLVDEAEALARLTLAAAEADAPKLPLKAHADAIHTLRKRWKELDRLGAAASQALWQRFDGALQQANVPVAAQQAQLKAAREENLAARLALLATLEASIGEPGPPPEGGTNADAQAEPPSDALKERLRALERFQLAWRQLGPLEHTVPAAARDALQQRWRDSVERVEAPLRRARAAAQAEREAFIARAEALAHDTRDAVPRVRELQAEWQQHARGLPLPRGVESALWSRFKAATDAVFAQREAAFSARDAELAANLAAREALIARLAALQADTPEAQLQRTLDEVDRAWRQAGEVPRAAVAALEARLREAHAAALAHLAAAQRQRDAALREALIARLACCEAREDTAGAEGAADGLAARWAALDTAAEPAAWHRALAERWSAPVAPGPLSGAEIDDVLLQLEMSFDLPAGAEQQAARRALKLRALKDTLEGRRAPSALQRDAQLAIALRQAGLTAAQRPRLRALLAAWSPARPNGPG